LLGVVDDVDALVVDLTDAGYVDSTGVRLLLELAERCTRSGHPVRGVVPADALLRRVVVLTKLDRVMEFHETVADALASLVTLRCCEAARLRTSRRPRRACARTDATRSVAPACSRYAEDEARLGPDRVII
jgi:hypothetical protein